MRKMSVRLSLAFLLFAGLPLGCTSSPSPAGSGGNGGSSSGSGGGGGTISKGGGSGGSTSSGGSISSGGSTSAGGGTTSAGGGSGGSTQTGGGGGSTETGGGGSTETGGGGTSDATGGSSGTGGDATGGTYAGTGGATSDATGGSSGTDGDATGGASAGTGGGGGTSATDGGTGATDGDQDDAQADLGGDMAGNSGNDAGESETGVSCTDYVQNGAETDVDCGGGTCAKCGSGRMCNSDDDCRNGNCASGKCADDFAATAPVTKDSNMWKIDLGNVIFEVDPVNSGKVAIFSFDGTDVVAKNIASTGSVFWTSPQDEWYTTPGQTWPPPTEMDGAAYTPSTSGYVLTMTGPVGDDKLSISKRYWGNVEHQAVTLEYTIHNNDSAAVVKAPWEITRVYTGGLTFFPNGEPALKLGDATFGPVPFTSAQGVLWFKYDSSDFTTTSSLKGGADGLEDWAAHIACGTGLEGSWAYPTCTKSPILIKEWTDIPAAAAAPAEKEVELYAAQNSYVEFEQQGAYQSIPAGGTLVWTMHWLLRYLPSGMLPISASTELPLLNWVRGQLL
jgi:hypothetical protein